VGSSTVVLKVAEAILSDNGCHLNAFEKSREVQFGCIQPEPILMTGEFKNQGPFLSQTFHITVGKVEYFL
jgi:hypothetical protein